MKLEFKIILLITSTSIALSLIIILISWFFIKNLTQENYTENASDTSYTAATVLDTEDFAAVKAAIKEIYDRTEEKVTSLDDAEKLYSYIEQYSEIPDMPEYQRLLAQLKAVQNANHVDCLYTGFFDFENSTCVYVVDAAEEDACPPGMADPLIVREGTRDDDPLAALTPNISDLPRYGKLITVGAPIYDSNNEMIGYTSADVTMEAVSNDQRRYITTLAIIILIVLAIINIVSIYLVNFFIVRPIKMISDAAEKYSEVYTDTESSIFDGIKIETRDEINELFDSICKMEHDVKQYYTSLLASKNELAYAKELANKDGLTGIRNKTAYNKEVRDLEELRKTGFQEFGIGVADLNFLKKINDTYGHEYGDKAIKKLCMIICTTFKHSPVFRIGGDEFAIVLKGQDFDQLEVLEASFNHIIKENAANDSVEPWERTSAALGIAVYNPAIDNTIDDLFRRADRTMYEKKAQMKAARA